MKSLYKKRGLTLIEIVVAIAILGLMAVVLLNMFATGYSIIFSMGRKTNKVNEAQRIVDKAFAAGDDSVIAGDSNYSTLSNLYVYESGKNSKYTKEDVTITVPINGVNKTLSYIKLTVVVFYENGKNHVEVTSLIPAGGI